MAKFLVECVIPETGELDSEDLAGMIQRANDELRVMSGSETHWIECHVTTEGCHWIYLAPDEVMVREHARRSGLAIKRIIEINRTLDPTFA